MAKCTARLRRSKADSCCGPCTVSGAPLWKCPSCGRPVSLALDLEVGEVGAHRPLEISRAIVADDCLRPGREIPTLPQRLSSMANTETENVS